MARPLRIDLIDGIYHVTARGNERRAIYRDDRDRGHFGELLERLVERFGVRILAYVLMENHYHLLVRTPDANLSAAMQWLGQSYAGWFNRRHRRAGHLFQGRFHGIVLEEGAAWEVSCYLHLNPVRLKRLGLDKAAQQRSRLGLGERPAAGVVAERLQRLRRYQWSSYGAYIGVRAAPGWLACQPVLALGGGRSGAERQRRYQQECEQAIREGLAASPWERLEAGVVLGGARFVDRVRRHLRSPSREQSHWPALQRRPGWERVVAVVERLKGERWDAFRDRYGDWGRDLAWSVGQEVCRLPLRELAERGGGVAYKTVATGIRRFQQRCARDQRLARIAHQAWQELKNGEM